MIITSDTLAAPDFMMVRAATIEQLGGANPAVLLTRIHWRCAEAGLNRVEDETGRWWRASREVLAKETGLTPNAVRFALEKLIELGVLEEAEHHLGERGTYDRTRSYRVTTSEPPSGEDIPTSTGGSPHGRISTGEEVRISARDSYSRDVVETSLQSSSQATPTKRSSKKTSFTHREPDDETSVSPPEESRALGSSPGRRSTEKVKQTAKERGSSALGLALRLEKGLADSGVEGGTTVSAVIRNFTRENRAGHGWPVLSLAVDLFLRNRARYTHRPDAAPWKEFFQRIDLLTADANKILKASGGRPQMSAAEKNEIDAREAEEIIAASNARKARQREAALA